MSPCHRGEALAPLSFAAMCLSGCCQGKSDQPGAAEEGVPVCHRQTAKTLGREAKDDTEMPGIGFEGSNGMRGEQGRGVLLRARPSLTVNR